MIDKLNFFIVLAAERHFGNAALKLGISQPSLSAAIRQLEHDLGVMLINRGSRFQNLTDEGNKVLTWALRITADTRTMKEEIRTRSVGLSGMLSIGAIPTAMPNIPEISHSFLRRHPNVYLKLLSLNSNEILGALERFEIDVGVTYLDNESPGKFQSVPFYSESYCLITTEKNFSQEKETISWIEAANLRLCLLTPDMQNRRILNQIFLAKKVSVMPTLEANSLIGLLSHVQTGEWSSILPLSIINSLTFNKNIISIPMESSYPRHKIGLIALNRDPSTPLISAFVKVAKGIGLKE